MEKISIEAVFFDERERDLCSISGETFTINANKTI